MMKITGNKEFFPAEAMELFNMFLTWGALLSAAALPKFGKVLDEQKVYFPVYLLGIIPLVIIALIRTEGFLSPDPVIIILAALFSNLACWGLTSWDPRIAEIVKNPGKDWKATAIVYAIFIATFLLVLLAGTVMMQIRPIGLRYLEKPSKGTNSSRWNF